MVDESVQLLSWRFLGAGRLCHLLLLEWWFRNRSEARFRTQKGRVSYPPVKVSGPLVGQLTPGFLTAASKRPAGAVQSLSIGVVAANGVMFTL